MEGSPPSNSPRGGEDSCRGGEYFNHIYGSDGAGFVGQFVKIRNNGLLVGDCDVETAQVRVLGKQLGQFADVREVEVKVFGIYPLARKLIIKERTRERVA